MNEKLFLFCYDIPADKAGNRRRRQLVKLLEGHGDRVQHSVFEARMKNEKEVDHLIERAKKILQVKLDSLRVYPFHNETEKGIRIIGQGDVVRIEDLYIV